MARPSRIWRFELPITDRPRIEMPRGARVLPAPPNVRNRDTIEFWSEVDPDAPMEVREFRVVGTGNPMPDDCGPFIGTVITHVGMFVWHVYEAGVVAPGGS